MPHRPPISVYPPNAPTWAQSGWGSEEHATPPGPDPTHSPPSSRPFAAASAIPGVQRITHWWATMTSLQLRGFVIAVMVLVGLSTTSLIANYWMLHASGVSPVSLRSAQSAPTMQNSNSNSGQPAEVRTVTLTTTPPTGRGALETATSTSEPSAGGATLQAGSAASSPANGLININTASVAELDGLPGVGPATAQAIVDYRTTNGPFSSVEELTAVDGIGEGKLAKIRGHATV
ncbi:ComEA family DNA-binding protein [Lawsonella clevelandensis]|uniref:ComEA family DNA-binding protein n=1 Tax=Lawsonella clevelandensis TaxID=1528099 RepID=UPI0023F420E1|nr:ComEA family DNA-binding protein [Lawsonella clevelandensis]